MGLDLDVARRVRPRSPSSSWLATSCASRKRIRAVDLEVERDARAPADLLDRDVMDEQPPPAGDHQHALEQGLVVERDADWR